MRKILFIGFGVLLSTFIAVLIITSSAKVKERFITITNSYSYVYAEDKKMEVPIYVNMKTHPLFERKYIRHVQLEANFGGFTETLRLTDIKTAGKEKYLNEDYYKLIYVLDLPKLGNTIFLPNCYISIDLDGFNKNYYFYIGDLTMYYYTNVGEEEAFSMTYLEGYKANDKFISRLSKIVVGSEFKGDAVIKSIEISKSFKVEYYISGNEITITVPNSNQMLSNVPIIITYQSGGEERIMVIDNFTYFVDYFLLLENGVFANVYPID